MTDTPDAHRQQGEADNPLLVSWFECEAESQGGKDKLYDAREIIKVHGDLQRLNK